MCDPVTFPRSKLHLMLYWVSGISQGYTTLGAELGGPCPSDVFGAFTSHHSWKTHVPRVVPLKHIRFCVQEGSPD